MILLFFMDCLLLNKNQKKEWKYNTIHIFLDSKKHITDIRNEIKGTLPKLQPLLLK